MSPNCSLSGVVHEHAESFPLAVFMCDGEWRAGRATDHELDDLLSDFEGKREEGRHFDCSAWRAALAGRDGGVTDGQKVTSSFEERCEMVLMAVDGYQVWKVEMMTGCEAEEQGSWKMEVVGRSQ